MNREEAGSAEWSSSETRRWFRRTWVAIVQAASFLVMVGLHRAMEWGLDLVIPSEWIYFRGFQRGAIGLIFTGIYLSIAIDTLVIFVPALDMIKRVINRTYDDTDVEGAPVPARDEAPD